MVQKHASILDYVHPGLDSSVWGQDGKLLPEHKEEILRKLNDFLIQAGIRFPEKWITGIAVVGSITTYQYARDTDIDVHIYTDLPAFIQYEKANMSEEEAHEFLDALRVSMSQEHRFVPNTEHPIEFFFGTPFTSEDISHTGKYDLVNDVWEKDPVSISSDFDIEESKPKFIEDAMNVAEEIDDKLGKIRQGVKRVEDLQDVIKEWSPEQRKKFQAKLEEKLKFIETEIEDLVKLKKEIMEKRKKDHDEGYDAQSEKEIKFKYLQKFGYFFIISRLRDLFDANVEKVTVTENDIPEIKEIVDCPIDVKGRKLPDLPPEYGGGKLLIDFDNTIANNGDRPHDEIGDPMPGVKEALENLKTEGWEIIIFSGRADDPGGADQIRDFMKVHDLPYDQIFIGKPMAEFIIDDRAIMFTNWSDVLKQVTKEAEQENNQEVKHDYSTTQFNMPKDVNQKIIEWCVENIPEEDLYDDGSGRFSRALECHMTVLYGLLDNDSKEVEKLLADEKPVTATFGKTFIFETPEKDALVIEVDCKDATTLHDKLKELENEDQQPEYSPHVTVAYVKSGKGKKYEGKDILKGEKVVLDTIKFNPKEGDPVFITLGQKKKASFDLVAHLVKNAVHLNLFSPDGEPLDGNFDLRPEVLKDFLNKGGVALDSSTSPWKVYVYDFEMVPDFLNVFLGKNIGWGEDAIFVNRSGQEQPVRFPTKNIKRQIHWQLYPPEEKAAAFTPSLVQAPDNDFQFAEGGDDVEIPVDPDSASDEETWEQGKYYDKPRKNFFHRIWDMITQDEKNPVKKKASAARGWLDPNGKYYNFGQFNYSNWEGVTHDDWTKNNETMLYKQYGIELDPEENPTSQLIENGWTRISDDHRKLGVHVLSLSNIPAFIDAHLAKTMGENYPVTVEDIDGQWVDVTDWSGGLQNAVNKEIQRKRMIERQTPMAASLNKHADASDDILKLMQETGGATYNLSQGNLAGTDNYAVSIYPERSVILDHDPSKDEINTYVQKNSDLLQNVENSFGVWKSNGQTYLDVVVTIPDLEKAKALGAQHNQIAIFDLKNFVEIPTGGTGEVQSKQAGTVNEEYWINPQGKVFHAENGHREWIRENLDTDILPSYNFTTEIPEDFYGDTDRDYGVLDEIHEEMLFQGWVRIGTDEYGDNQFIVEVADLQKIPPTADDFIASHFKEGAGPIDVGTPAGVDLIIENPFPTLQTAVNKAIVHRHRKSSLSLSKHADTNGYWISPEGKEIVLGPTQEHAKVIRQYGLTWPEAITNNNWVRIRMDGDVAYIEVKDLRNVSPLIEDFIIRHPVRTMIIEEPYHGAWVEVSPDDMLESNLQYAIKDELKRRKAAALARGIIKVAVNQEQVADFYLMSLLPPEALSSKNVDPEHYDALKIFQEIVMGLREEYIERGMAELKDEAETTQWVADIPESEMPEELKPYYKYHESGYSGNFSGDPDEEDNYDTACERCGQGLYEDDAYNFNENTYCESCQADVIHDTLKEEALYCVTHHIFVMPEWLKDELAWTGDFKNAADSDDHEHDNDHLVSYDEGVSIQRDRKENEKNQLQFNFPTDDMHIRIFRNKDGNEFYWNTTAGWVTDRAAASLLTDEQMAQIRPSDEEGVSWVAAGKKMTLKKTAYDSEYQGGPYWEAPRNFSNYTAMDYYKIFKYAPWKSQYGGPLWAEVARTIYEMQHTQDLQKLVVLIDHFHDLGHNTGKLLDKFPEWHEWFKRFLDRKAQKNSLRYLLQLASRPVRDLVMDYLRVNKHHWLDEVYDRQQAAGLSKYDIQKKASDYQNVLLICSGNTCRSPMAENILKHVRPDLNVISRGIYVSRSMPNAPMVEQVLKEKNIPYEPGMSAQVSPEDVQWADVILTMEDWQIDELEDMIPAAKGKTFTLDSFDVPDPVGGDVKDYQQVRDQIQQALDKLSALKTAQEVICPNCGKLREHEDIIQDGKCDLCNQTPKHETTWDDTRQDMEPSKPLPTTFEWSTNDENMNQRYPWKFIRHPNGPDYSNENSVNDMLIEDPTAIASRTMGLSKYALTDFAAWIDPTGKVYDVRSEGKGGTHIGWIESNLLLLQHEYNYEIPVQEGTWLSSGQLAHIFNMLLEQGWVRIGDSLSHGVSLSIQLANMRNIPSYVDDYLASVYEPGMKIEVEEGGDFKNAGRTVSLDNPFPTLQKAVNRALSSQLPMAAALSKYAFSQFGFWVAPDGKAYDVRKAGKTHGDWVVKNAALLESKYGMTDVKKRDYFDVAREMLEKGWARIGDTSRNRNLVGVEVADIRNLPSYIDNALATFMTDGQPLIVADLNDNWAEVTWPFKSLQNEVRRNRRRASLLKVSFQAGWLAPDEKFYPTNQLTHADWVSQNRNKLKKRYNLNIPKTDDYRELVEFMLNQNWVRATGDFSDGYEVRDIHNIPRGLEDLFHSDPGEMFYDTVVEDIQGNSVRLDLEEALENGLQETINRELRTPTVSSKEKPSDSSKLPMLQREQIYAGNESTTYSDNQMEEIYDEQHAEDMPDGNTGGGNVYHDWNQSTNDFPKAPTKPKFTLDQLTTPENGTLPSYEVSWFMGQPRGDDTE